MIGALIGLAASLFTILLFTFIKRFDKNTIYGLILMGIAFLYIGYTWTNIEIAIMSFVQMLFFLIFAYFGITKNAYFLVAGYFLHGVWDFVYPLFGNPDLLPPHYDYFCSVYDIVVAIYLFIINYKAKSAIQEKS